MLRAGTLCVRQNDSHRLKGFPRKAWEPEGCEGLRSGQAEFLKFAIKGFAVYAQGFSGFSFVAAMEFEGAGNKEAFELLNSFSQRYIVVNSRPIGVLGRF